MKLISIVFNKATSEYRLYYKDKETGKPYHITANHLLDKEKLWARGANYHQGPYPTREARDNLDTVRGICARYNVRRELRGYYQATYIREEVTPA